jgi:putative hydrolase of the HAD superfamily
VTPAATPPDRATALVLFDVGSTLIDPHPSAQELLIQVLAEHGRPITLDDLARAEPPAWQAVADRLPFHRYGQDESREFWDAFYQALLGQLGVAPEPALRAALYQTFQRMENWRLYPDAVPVLQELRQRGYGLGVVSNWEEWLEDLLLALDVHALFDFIVASGPFGRAKPDRSIFEHALRLANAAPSAAVHIGDSVRDDVAGARAAGLRPILIDRRGRHAGLDVERVGSLSELLDLL